MRSFLVLFFAVCFMSAGFSQQETVPVFDLVIYVHDGANVSIANAKVTVLGSDGTSFTGYTDKSGRLEFLQTAELIYLNPGQTYTIEIAGVENEYYKSSTSFTTEEGVSHSRIIQGISVTRLNSTETGG